jgi:hypothetical protein
MALVLNDRVRETTSVVGTGAVTLLGAVTGFQSFSTIGNANTTYYCISDQAGANWEVGIGTYTSAGTLLARTTVLASSNAGALVSFTGGTKDVFVTYPSEKGVWYDASGNVLFTGTTTAANLAYTGTLTGSTGILNIGSGQVYKDASGNVGIGTSSPQAKEHIAVTTSAITETLRLDNIFNTGDNGNKITWYNAAQTPEAANISGFRIGATTGFGLSFSTSSNFATTAAVERMRIDSSGNVGIGTSSPTVKFQVGTYLNSGVAGTALISGANIAALNTAGMLTVAATDSIAADIGGSVGFTANGTIAGYPTGSIAGRRENATASNYASYMQFSTCSSVGAVVEKMRIDSSGNVGIGTSSPSTKLTVAGSITITGANALRGSYGGGAITSNFAAGDGALYSNTTGYSNTASGVNALYNNTTGSGNSASGVNALYSNTTGYYNTASGLNALSSNTTGYSNTASGVNALSSNTTGNSNTASGLSALSSNTTGNYNTASGRNALYNNTTGYSNTASGVNALYNNTTGSGNSAFNPLDSAGMYAPVFNPTTENNRFCMGSAGVTNAYIQVAWTVVSDARDKTNFAPVPHGLDFVNQLQPTAYQFKENRETDVATGIVRYGFKAQDVLALEGDSPVIIDNEDLDKLRFNESSLIPVLVNAIKELTARLELLEGK